MFPRKEINLNIKSDNKGKMRHPAKLGTESTKKGIEMKLSSVIKNTEIKPEKTARLEHQGNLAGSSGNISATIPKFTTYNPFQLLQDKKNQNEGLTKELN